MENFYILIFQYLFHFYFYFYIICKYCKQLYVCNYGNNSLFRGILMKNIKTLSILLMLIVIMGLGSFANAQDEYTIMVYLNGSDLESTYDAETNSYAGSATTDLNEMLEGQPLTDKVNVIVQTGGTKKWVNPQIDASKTQRFELVDGKLVEVQSLPMKNIGYKKTLSDFVIWAEETYPADKYALILWNHGGGPVGGFGVDELSSFDSLQLEEIDAALNTAKARTNITLELIGFDACLMASIEVADTVKDYAKYMVASEELEPGHGWDYKGILTALNMAPDMDGAKLGKIIASSYLSHAKSLGTDSDVTLSVLDLSKISQVVTTFDGLIQDADARLVDNIFFYEFARSALAAKSFGGNTQAQGYTDLVDLNAFANGLLTNQPVKAQALINAVNQAVIFKVDGPFSFQTSGLSIYFPYRDKANYLTNIQTYEKTGFSPTYVSFLKNFKATISKHNVNSDIAYTVYEPTEERPFFELVLEQEGLDKVYYVYIDLYTSPMIPTEATYTAQYLGYDFLVDFDESTNSYFENFTYAWTFLDTEPLLMFVTHDYGDVVEYESPVLYNGEYMNLIYAWITKTSLTGEDLSHYEVYGLRRQVNPETGMPDKNLYQLEAGATIQPVYHMITEEGVTDQVAGNPILLTEASSLEFKELDQTDYLLQFRMTDFAFDHYLTDLYGFTK